MCHVDDSDISDNDLGDFAILTILCGQSCAGDIFQYLKNILSSNFSGI